MILNNSIINNIDIFMNMNNTNYNKNNISEKDNSSTSCPLTLYKKIAFMSIASITIIMGSVYLYKLKNQYRKKITKINKNKKIKK